MGSGFDIKGVRRILAKERIKLERKRTLVWALLVIIVTGAVVFTFFQTILGLGRITESSMLPTLHVNDFVVYNRIYGTYEAGDIVVFTELSSRHLYIKRVIAVGGDTVDIPGDGGVYVNGELLSEPYLYDKVETKTMGDVEFPLIVPEGYLFVLGDNREVSIDSRWSKVGMIKEKNISGKLIFPDY